MKTRKLATLFIITCIMLGMTFIALLAQSTTVEVDSRENCFTTFPTMTEIHLPNGTYDVQITDNETDWTTVCMEYPDSSVGYWPYWKTIAEDQTTTLVLDREESVNYVRFFMTDTYPGDNWGQITVTITPVGANEKQPGWCYERCDLVGSNYYPFPSTVPTTGAFAEKWSSADLGDCNRVLTGDVTGDGKLEVIVTKNSELKILNSEGQEYKSITVNSSNCYVTMIEDVNGDGVDDIGVGCAVNNGDLRIFFYDGNGNLLQTLSKTGGGYDSSIFPYTKLPNGNILVSNGAGYSKDPRGYSVFDFTTGNEIWYYDVGPNFTILSITDMDNDEKLEFVNNAGTVHNGAQGTGNNGQGTPTSDSEFCTIVVDEDGNEVFTLQYDNSGGGESNKGWVHNFFVDLNRDNTIEILVSESHTQSSYPGTSQIHLIDTSLKEIFKTFNGKNSNTSWEVAVADVNNDNKDEVIASNGGITQYILDYNLNVLHEADISGRVKLVNDLDGDGTPEILLTDGQKIRILSSTLTEKWIYTFGGDVQRVIVSDNDGNGKNELIVLAEDKLYVLEGGYEVTQASKEPGRQPIEVVLSQNFPNPFNPETQIEYAVPNQGLVTLQIYNELGQPVRSLVNEERTAGNYTTAWDGRDERGSQVASGRYFYRLKVGKNIVSRSMLLVK